MDRASERVGGLASEMTVERAEAARKEAEEATGIKSGSLTAPQRAVEQAASEEEACAEILKRLKVLNIRLNAPKG